jgi:UDP-N-acetylglucosamine transferase subunit ALG13
VVITHGGAGTLLACLYDPNPAKKVVAVANNSLAGNHQTELIAKLHQEHCILGFNSVPELRQGQDQLLRLLRGEVPLQKYARASKSVLNQLVFGEDP